eukprot:TRINITY_DN41011_c0_g1_i1.p1 TRINITY_DN41011_c0_g1~~TRINITY_DN41011_c0_g1_i1.p1  ORF type:complete len:272 (-),score=45.94 TRINITY_DN41011_c0_g1_i1:90-905(-)
MKATRSFDGTCLPTKRLRTATASNAEALDAATPLFVFGHGLTERLGAYDGTDPERDKTCVDIPQVVQSSACAKRPDVLLYDARGHGESTGWEDCGPEQFHWRCLGVDMLQVASAHQSSTGGCILGGCSMGAASALWAAMLSPRSVKGLVLYMVPAVWDDRRARRKALEDTAASMRAADPTKADVFLGAARADLPPREELACLAELPIPVLIVNCRDDPIHPASSAEAVGEIFGSKAKVVIVDTTSEIVDAFNAALKDWLVSLPILQVEGRS